MAKQRLSFDEWRLMVNKTCEAVTTMSLDDLGDVYNLRDAYDKGQKPENAAKAVIKANGGQQVVKDFNKKVREAEGKPPKPTGSFLDFEDDVRGFVAKRGRLSYSAIPQATRQTVRQSYERGESALQTALGLIGQTVSVVRSGNAEDATGEEFEQV